MARKIVATLMRSTGPGLRRTPIWTRYYSYFDTAMPRAVQLALTYGQEGDVVEFASNEHGFQLGTLHVLSKGRFDLKMSSLVKASPTLLKLMSENLQ